MNLFELFVKIGVDDQASGKLSKLSSSLGKGIATAAKIGTAAVATAAAGITALTTAAVNNYAEYEQLVGGVDTLFKDASKKVQQYAADAYKTAGMSANDYMANATAFSASLISSLGGDTEKAAEYANRAMVSMSDNANKMGTSIDSIVQTYQSLARGNMAMLDNLKLGYGGTKAELERLIKDAASYTDIQKEMGITVDASSMSFDNIVNAIAVVQGKLGIAGATAAEAATTIEGSLNSMRAAWSNLVTGIANENADFGSLVDQFVESIVTVGDNILPRIEVALQGAVKLISSVFPKIAEALPGLIETLVPPLISGIVNVASAILGNLPQIIDSILSILPDLINQIVSALTDGGVIEKLTEAVVGIVQAIANNLPTIIQAIVDAIPKITESVNSAILNNFPELLQAIIQIVLSIVKNLPTIIQMLVDQIGPIVSTIVQVIVENLPAFIAGIVQIVAEIVKALPSILASVGESILQIFSGIGSGLANAWPKFKEGIVEVWNKVVEWFDGLWDKAGEIGGNIIDGIKEGIKNAWKNLKEWFSGLFDDLIGIAKQILGIASPSKVFKKIGLQTAQGYQIGFDDEFAHVKDDMEDALNFDDASVGINASIRKVGAGAAGGAFGGTSIGNINITVNGAKYDDEQSLASAIALEIQNMTDRRAAVYA